MENLLEPAFMEGKRMCTYSFWQKFILCQETWLVKVWVIVPILWLRLRDRQWKRRERQKKERNTAVNVEY